MIILVQPNKKENATVKAFVDVTVQVRGLANDIDTTEVTLKGFRVIQGKDGLFVAPPSRESVRDGKKTYPDTVVISEAGKGPLFKKIMAEYQATVKP